MHDARGEKMIYWDDDICISLVNINRRIIHRLVCFTVLFLNKSPDSGSDTPLGLLILLFNALKLKQLSELHLRALSRIVETMNYTPLWMK